MMAKRKPRIEATDISTQGGDSEPRSGTDSEEKPTQSPPSSPSPQPAAELFALDPELATDDQLQDIADRQMAADASTGTVAEAYNILFLYDDDSIGRPDANRIYRALGSVDQDKPILLVMSSPGGDIAAAYFIAKLCREYTRATFEVAVPREAKSAATLIACGADRIHMGSLSELGPIDPQFGHIPALALKYSVEHIASLAKMYPDASKMFADYLSKALRIEALGFYERVAESAAQYAMRLLRSRHNGEASDNKAIADRLVYEYKDHGFVIDAHEAAEIFGQDVVRTNTDEYQFANKVYSELDFLAYVMRTRFMRDFSFTGARDNGCWVFTRTT